MVKRAKSCVRSSSFLTLSLRLLTYRVVLGCVDDMAAGAGEGGGGDGGRDWTRVGVCARLKAGGEQALCMGPGV